VRIETIDSLDDPRLAFYTNLTDVSLRRLTEPSTGLYLAESTKVIERALAAGHRPVSVITLDKWLGGLEPLLAEHDIPVFVGDESELEKLTGFLLHRGAIAAMERPPLASVAEIIRGARRVVILENIIDHTNVGAIFRSVAGLGADAVLITPECADPLYRRSVRVSMGTVLQVPWTRVASWPDGLQELKDAGFVVASLALSDDAITLAELSAENPERLAVIFGTEGHGLSPAAMAASDRVVRIPMSHGVDSLNVAAAAAVTLYAVTNTP
jgi:tRNA G18 (ribose-2'-O)-methylase SpoU